MLDELNLPMEQKLILVIILAILNIFLWRDLGHFHIDVEPKKKDTRKLQNANYGAYIQAQGRYYN
ncbi:hypothetical protein GGG87_02310 [Streptococcus sp. zg-86]|uniref:Phage membrane protein n=2 Tax=Streptococcus zhangguiae TaxID=2664091 RepID=A0A6I4RAY3_9STRE|nr:MULTISPECIES: hypothetical protein [unclassified Streptococcus]MTB63846.1 hypothetical protein [Streptococcus sp. zg-86]MTB90156.1 hypothetical protein [Streptococcus sp. zg-36]MWV55828.1 hypothetical protein [Streptococcus sp. zg-70]QTH48787.1 hypothetical protein J5M87_00690 [Streptococcus sp. zg-86]